MKAEMKEKIITTLKAAPVLLGLVPDAPGAADDVAKGILRLLFAAIIRLLSRGWTVVEIIEVLDGLGPAARLDVDAEVEAFADGE